MAFHHSFICCCFIKTNDQRNVSSPTPTIILIRDYQSLHIPSKLNAKHGSYKSLFNNFTAVGFTWPGTDPGFTGPKADALPTILSRLFYFWQSTVIQVPHSYYFYMNTGCASFFFHGAGGHHHQAFAGGILIMRVFGSQGFTKVRDIIDLLPQQNILPEPIRYCSRAGSINSPAFSG